MALINDYFRGMLGTHSAAPSTAATAASTPSRQAGVRLHQDDPLPSGTGTIPTWRGVTDIFGTAG